MSISDDITGWREYVGSDRKNEFRESVGQECSGDSIMKCVFDKVDEDRNGLVTLPEFLTFLMNSLKLDDLEVKRGKTIFHQTGEAGEKGTINFPQFAQLITDIQDKDGGVIVCHMGLRLEQALQVYMKEQDNSHKRRNNKQCPTRNSAKGSNLLHHQSLIVQMLARFLCPDAKSVLEFWFPCNMQDAMTLWFGKSPTLDEEIRSKFGGLVERARKGELDKWSRDPVECLALVVLLDQFPRNIYRHDPLMYASDAKAQAICTKALYYNYHRYVTPLQAIFIPCLVLTHSEQLQHQELCVDVWKHYVQKSLCPEDPLRIFEMIFIQHLKVVEKYGRFPHRNEIHGRKCTPDEEQFLNDPAFRFDLPLRYSDDGKVVFEETKDFKEAADSAKQAQDTEQTEAQQVY